MSKVSFGFATLALVLVGCVASGGGNAGDGIQGSGSAADTPTPTGPAPAAPSWYFQSCTGDPAGEAHCQVTIEHIVADLARSPTGSALVAKFKANPVPIEYASLGSVNANTMVNSFGPQKIQIADGHQNDAWRDQKSLDWMAGILGHEFTHAYVYPNQVGTAWGELYAYLTGHMIWTDLGYSHAEIESLNEATFQVWDNQYVSGSYSFDLWSTPAGLAAVAGAIAVPSLGYLCSGVANSPSASGCPGAPSDFVVGGSDRTPPAGYGAPLPTSTPTPSPSPTTTPVPCASSCFLKKVGTEMRATDSAADGCASDGAYASGTETTGSPTCWHCGGPGSAGSAHAAGWYGGDTMPTSACSALSSSPTPTSVACSNGCYLTRGRATNLSSVADACGTNDKCYAGTEWSSSTPSCWCCNRSDTTAGSTVVGSWRGGNTMDAGACGAL